MPRGNVLSEQTIETAVSGPGDANRLLICTGQAGFGQAGISVEPDQSAQQTWTFPVGPSLPHPQFHRATASVAAAHHIVHFPTAPPDESLHLLQFESVEADWDDESGRTELRVEVHMACRHVRQELHAIGFTAFILAALPDE